MWGIALLLLRVVARLHGVAAAIASDLDIRFTRHAWQYMCKELSIQLKMSTSYHPQAHGQAERTKQTIEQVLRWAILGDDTNWSEFLPLPEFAYISAAHASKRTTPSELNYGFTPARPLCRKLGLTPRVSTAILPLKYSAAVGQAGTSGAGLSEALRR